MKKFLSLIPLILGIAFCVSIFHQTQAQMIKKNEMQRKVAEFADVDLNAPELIAQLSEKEKQIIPIFIIQ